MYFAPIILCNQKHIFNIILKGIVLNYPVANPQQDVIMGIKIRYDYENHLANMILCLASFGEMCLWTNLQNLKKNNNISLIVH